jgi:hypothetical protein
MTTLVTLTVLSVASSPHTAVPLENPARAGKSDLASDAIVFRGRVVDPDGRQFAGPRVYLEALESARFTVLGLNPPKPRALAGLFEGVQE